MNHTIRYSRNELVNKRMDELTKLGKLNQASTIVIQRATLGDGVHTIIYSIIACWLTPDLLNNKIDYKIAILEEAIRPSRKEQREFTVMGHYDRDKAYYERAIKGGEYQIPIKAIIAEDMGARLFKTR